MNIVINGNTYGYVIKNEFACTHGGWSSPIEFLDDGLCSLKYVRDGEPLPYEEIDAIPIEYYI